MGVPLGDGVGEDPQAGRRRGRPGQPDPRHQVRFVINRRGQANELPVAEAEQALGEKLAHFIPDDPKTINGANNAGIPAVMKAPSAKVSQSLIQLAKVALERRRGEAAA